MSKRTESRPEILYPASIIGLLEAPSELEYKKYQQYEDPEGNRYLENNGRFFGLSFQKIEERFHLLENLPKKGRTFIETFILRTKDNLTGNIVATKTGPMPLLLKEAEVLSKVAHSNIAQFLGLAVSENTDPCLVLEWLNGGTLEDRIKDYENEISLSWIKSVTNQIADAITHTNNKGYIHADVKPQNIMFDDQERAKVIDFGNSVPIIESGSSAPNLEIAATKLYASPEQLELAGKNKGRLHIQSDVYSFAAVVFEMLTSETGEIAKMFRDLFVSETDSLITLRKAPDSDILSLLKQQKLAKTLRRSLAFDYKERPSSVKECNSEIQDILA